MEAERLTAWKKAVLLTGGAVKVSPDFRSPFPLSRSTAGPGAGSASIVLGFEGTRVKKAISAEEGDFELLRRGDRYSILHEGKVLVEEVELQRTLHHCPEQAFFNLGTACVYSCAFCTSPHLDERITKSLDADKIVRLIMEAEKRGGLKAVALTSAVVSTPQETVDRMVEVVRRVREVLPTIPIGVEPYVDRKEQIDRLKKMGADEIKLNIETFDRDIFSRVCEGQDIDWVLEAISHAVTVFGRGRVTSNIIIGMGESDQNILDGVRELAQRGCIAILRPLRLNELNREAMERALGKLAPLSPERLILLAEEHKRILQEHGLDARTVRTMCHECKCCDIVPFHDI